MVGASNSKKERIISLSTGCTVTVDETRSLVELPLHPTLRRHAGDETGVNGEGWKAISSAIWKGGLRSFSCRDKPPKVNVFNFKVPSTYDGLNPEPKALLRNAIGNEPNPEFSNKNRNDADSTTEAASLGSSNKQNYLDDETTVGIMTAASMQSLRTASRSAGGISVDVIVTAGVSNSRTAGADADVFYLLPPQQERKPPPGTINSVVVINGAPLSDGALVEAYAICLEAKCAACADLRLPCAKSLYGNDLAQGTGTDCAVLLAPSEASVGTPVLEYAGKHCILAELIGQAVKEATTEAILTNIYHLHGSLWKYHLWRWRTYLAGLLWKGSRPCVPPKPMMPVPGAPFAVLALGWGMVVTSYVVGLALLPRSATVLMAATFWDRCLSEPPLSFHPVVLAGTTISIVTKKWVPESVYQSPVLGFCAGVLFMIGTLILFASAAHLFLLTIEWIPTLDVVRKWTILHQTTMFGCWVLEVMLVKTAFSLQLLCTIALQMAKFLERSQLEDARNQLSWLCSRDPTHLGSGELAGGTLESLSENLSDGTVAPWFWYIFFGPVGALGYRVANTLDSRVGYRGRFEWFGKASARFDDLINLIPARLTAIFLCAAAAIVGPENSANRGFETAWKDCTQCDSPNAGWPMGAMAGILGVRLEKKGQYALGKSIPGAKEPTPRDIRLGHRVAELAGGLAFVTAVIACILKD